MVYSNINNSILYKDVSKIDPEDKGYESPIYEMDIFGKTVVTTLGKPKHTFSSKGIVYYPIYLVANGKIKSQIGVFEILSSKMISLIDEDGDVDVSQLDKPLLFGFVNSQFIDRYGSDIDTFMRNLEKEGKDENENETKIEEESEKKEKEKEKEDEEKEQLDLEIDESLNVNVSSSKKSKETEKALKTLQSGIFDLDTKIKPPSSLEEETKEDSRNITLNYKPTNQDVWISKWSKNPNYGIHEVEANGDCLFAVIRDAFKELGQITTVAKLRAIVAKEATMDVFQNQRDLYLQLDSLIKSYDKELKELRHTLEHVLKERAKKAQNNPTVMESILKEIESVKTQYAEILANRRSTKQLVDESLSSFARLDTLEKFREHIQTTSYWADVWSISVLERVLQMKMIIFSQRAYIDGATNDIIQCGELDKELQRTNLFTPKYYIMTTFSGDHYRLITYKSKRIFQFHEIPYYVKIKIINKCIQRDEGPFYMISDFRHLASKLNVEEELRKLKDDEDSDEEEIGEKDSSIVFVFHSKSDKTKKPGKGAKEKIPTNKMADFIPLHRIANWRRKLDDEWMEAPFNLDGHKWASVEHYYQGAKFTKHNPEFRLLFTLDGPEQVMDKETIATSIDLARIAGSKTGKTKGNKISLRPETVTIDPDFYGERSQNERKEAVRAKFSQNEDLKQLLLATQNAKLKHLTTGPPEKDTILMQIREELQSEK